MTFEAQGYGAEWDAELVGGPFDGLEDLVISVNDDLTPPKFLTRTIGDYPEKKPKLGEKMLEYWKHKHIPEETKIAVYILRGEETDYDEDDDNCIYDFVETTTYGEFRKLHKQ